MKNSDFFVNGIQLPPGANAFNIGEEKIKIDGFTFNKNKVTTNPAFLFSLLIAADPTEKQKEILDAIELKITDDYGKQFYPPIKKEGEENGD